MKRIRVLEEAADEAIAAADWYDQQKSGIGNEFSEAVDSAIDLIEEDIAFSPVGRELLTDRPHQSDAVAEMDFLKVNPRFQEPNLSPNLAFNTRWRALAADMGVPAASLAIAWLTHQGDHILPIPGTRNIEHLKELAQGASMDLSAEDLARIDEVLPIGWAHGDRYSTGQWAGPEKYC